MQVVAKYIIGEKLELELLNSSVVLIVNLEHFIGNLQLLLFHKIQEFKKVSFKRLSLCK